MNGMERDDEHVRRHERLPVLIDAARRKDVAAAEALILSGADVNARSEDGYSALMFAAAQGVGAITELLLSSGADVHMLDTRMGASALHKAAQGGNVEVLGLLLDCGAFIDLQSATLGHTPLRDAVWHKQVDAVRFLLQRGAKTTLRAHDGTVALDEAKTSGLTEIAEAIETRDAEDARIVVRQTLMAATKANDVTEVRRLVQAGAPVDEPAPMVGDTYDGYTPLGAAATLGHADVVEALVQAAANPRLLDGLMHATPGHKAGYMGRADVARVLIDHRTRHRDDGRGLDLDAQGAYNGFTALHDAVWHGHAETARVFVDAGARLDVRGLNGMTPRELAIFYGYDDIATMLRAAGEKAADTDAPDRSEPC